MRRAPERGGANRRRRAALLLAAGLCLLSAGRAVATSYVMISDEELAEQAEVIAQAIVLASEPAPVAGPPATDHFVQIERVIEGYVAGSTVVVRVPGGISPEGVGLRIFGAPRFRAGERVLLFLTPRSDGTYAILHLMLGAFHEVQSGGARLAVRDLSEALEAAPGWINPGAAAGMLDGPRDFEGFVEWLTDRRRGDAGSGGYIVSLPAADLPEPVSEAVILADRCTGLSLRRFAFDRSAAVEWHLDSEGFDGRGGGRRELGRALEAWQLAGPKAIRMRLGGGSGPYLGLGSMDGLDSLVFGDPGDDVAGRFRCPSGGVLAISGVWFDNGRNQDCQVVGPGVKGSYRGRWYLEILSADIVGNDGNECFFAGNPEGTAEVLAHELGHTLGLRHLASPGSLMRGPVHDDGRGATPSPADLQALETLYGDGGGTSP